MDMFLLFSSGSLRQDLTVQADLERSSILLQAPGGQVLR